MKGTWAGKVLLAARHKSPADMRTMAYDRTGLQVRQETLVRLIVPWLLLWLALEGLKCVAVLRDHFTAKGVSLPSAFIQFNWWYATRDPDPVRVAVFVHGKQV